MIDWLAGRWNAFIDFMWRLVLSIYDMLKDFFFWMIEQLMSVGVYILDAMGYMFNGLDVAQYFSAIPPETSHMLLITGFSEALGMVTTFLGIRIIIQMIPFVRWGS